MDLSTVAADEKVENQEKTDSDKDKSADSDTKDKPEEVKDKPKTEKEIEEEKKKVRKNNLWSLILPTSALCMMHYNSHIIKNLVNRQDARILIQV